MFLQSVQGSKVNSKEQTAVLFGRHDDREGPLSSSGFVHPLVQHGLYVLLFGTELWGPRSVGCLKHKAGLGIELDAVSGLFFVSKMAMQHLF